MIVVMPPRRCRMRISRAISWRNVGVQVGQRFVKQQHARMDRQRARQRDALLLTARQLARQPRRECLQLHETQHLGNARLSGGGRHAPHLQPERDVARDR